MPWRGVLACAATVVLAGCSVAIGADGGSDTSAAPSTAAAPSSIDPAEQGARSILDGWVSFQLAPGWEVIAEAEGLEPRRADFDRPALVPSVDDLQTLVEIGRTDGRARISLLREPAYLDVPDIDTWTDVLVEEVAGDAVELVAEDVVQAAHGPIRRLRFEGASGTLLFGTTAFDDQRLVVLASADSDLDDAEHQELRELAAALELDPDVRLNPMLQHHGGLYVYDRGGERVVEVALDVPSNWSSADEPDGVRYVAPDDGTTVEVYVSPGDGRTPAEVLDAALGFRPDRDPIIRTDEQRLGEVDVTVVRHGLEGTTADLDRSTSWVIVGETDGVMVEIYLDDTRPDTDALLLHRIFDTIEIRTP